MHGIVCCICNICIYRGLIRTVVVVLCKLNLFALSHLMSVLLCLLLFCGGLLCDPGEAVYKVKDNVFWETESGKQRLLLQQQQQQNIGNSNSNSNSTSSTTTTAATAVLDIENNNNTSMYPISSLPVSTNPTHNHNNTNEVCENNVDFIPISENKTDIVPNETNAWELIQKWQSVSEERRHRKPDFDTYNARNDESISTSSLLTFSVTEAPSTGGVSLRCVCM